MDMKLFLTTFGVVFLAELGDKTQLAALSLTTSGNGGPWTVFFGASMALVCSTALAVICGGFLDKYINMKYLNIGSALLFILLGVISLTKFAMTSSEFTAEKTAVVEEVKP